VLTRRIICCLDVRDARVVKGIRFEGLRDVGDPVELARRYAERGADELCLLNVSASLAGASPMLDVVERVARAVFVPFTVGGGIRSAEDARAVLRAGADKIALNTAALNEPRVIGQLASEFGSQCVVLSIDTRRVDGHWFVTTHSATRTLERSCLDWAREGVERGAGEILLNVVDTDGGREGFEIGITRRVAELVPVPVIASGGAGEVRHFERVFSQTEASAALAASIFHDGTWTPERLKGRLRALGIEVRP
jgi:cyclase